jgi:hypothetical protein
MSAPLRVFLVCRLDLGVLRASPTPERSGKLITSHQADASGRARRAS